MPEIPPVGPLKQNAGRRLANAARTPIAVRITGDACDAPLEAVARIREALSGAPDAHVLAIVRDEAAADAISQLLSTAELRRVQYLWNVED